MTISPPPSVNYPNQLTSFPTKTGVIPPEGQRMIQIEIDWGTMGGAKNSVFFNLQNNAVMNFSQVVAFSVDNSQCGGDIQFIFPENSETLTIPAYTPKAVIPVFTNQTQFYVAGLGVEPEDITRFTILNYLPPPVVVPTSEEQNVASVLNLSTASASGSQQIVPLGVSGTLEAIQVLSNIGAAGASFGEMAYTIQDGESTPKVIVAGQSGALAGGTLGAITTDLTGIHVRFVNGLTFSWTASGVVSGGVSINAFYRTP